MCVARVSGPFLPVRAPPRREQEALQLEYLVYGKFRFKHSDSKGVDRLGTEWVPVEKTCKMKDWGQKEDKFDETVRAMRDGHDSDSSTSSDDSDEDD